MKKLFGFIFKLIPIAIIFCVIAGYFLYKPWYERQWHKIKGVYYVYQGDKAYEKLSSPDANVAKEISSVLKNYNLGLKEYPEHYQAHCNLANIYVTLEDYTSAVKHYNLALKYKPNYIECRMNLGILKAEEFLLYDEAISEYNKITKANIPKWHQWNIPFIYNNVDAIKGNKMNAYYNMGLAYRGKTLFVPTERLKYNQYLKDAVVAYNKAIDAYKKHFKKNKKYNNYDALFNLALTHHYLGNVKEAGLNYCNAIEDSPKRYEAHLNLAILLDSLKYHKEAISEFEKAGLLIDEGDYETLFYLNDLLNTAHKKNDIMKEKEALIALENAAQKEEKKWYDIFIKKDKEEKNEQQNSEFEEQTIMFKNGKAKIVEESQKSFDKRIKQCESRKIFEEM